MDQWGKETLQRNTRKHTPDITHISEDKWGARHVYQPPKGQCAPGEIDIHSELQKIRTNAPITQNVERRSEIRKMATGPYTESEIKDQSQVSQSKRMAQTESQAKSTRPSKHGNKTAHHTTRKIQQGHEIHQNGNMAQRYTYTRQSGARECKNYRPFCLTQIAYEIWPTEITRRLENGTHIATGTDEYGYKQGRPTLDASHK